MGPDTDDRDGRMCLAAFSHVRALTATGERYPLVNPQRCIFKPRQIEDESKSK